MAADAGATNDAVGGGAGGGSSGGDAPTSDGGTPGGGDASDVATPSIPPSAVSTYTTSGDGSVLLSRGADLAFSDGPATAATVIAIDEHIVFQSIDGFGASMTDSAAYLLHQVASPAARDAAMKRLFSTDGDGAGLSFLRNPLGSSDIARNPYSYDDNGGAADPGLAHFSFAHDLEDIVPLTAQAKALAPDLSVMLTPWSPPGWMKSNGSMLGQVGSAAPGTLLDSMASSWAQYLVAAIAGYRAAGVSVEYLSLQNEPLYAPTSYAGMSMSADQQTTVLRDVVLPALEKAGGSTRVLVYDHNWDGYAYPTTVLSDPKIAASPLVAGIAWHGYGGTPGIMGAMGERFPSFGQWLTEHSGGTWVGDQIGSDFAEIPYVLRNGGKGYVKWSLALDENRGPNDGGCNVCSAPITVDSKSGDITYNPELATLGQFSKFARPGAHRIHSTNAAGLVSVGFSNPDGSKALFVYASTDADVSFSVQWGGRHFDTKLAAHSGVTFHWTGTQDGSTVLDARATHRLSGNAASHGFQTEVTSDEGAGWDLGYGGDGSYARISQLRFSSSLTKAQLRFACDGGGSDCGGNVELHADAIDGPLVASFALSPTGGWQSWQTSSAPLTGAAAMAGVHDVFVVAKKSGTAGLGNLDWIAFE